MKAKIEDFKTGWYRISLGLNDSEIDDLIETLTSLKSEKTHFHFRSDFKGDGGVGDVEFYHSTTTDKDLIIENSCRELK